MILALDTRHPDHNQAVLAHLASDRHSLAEGLSASIKSLQRGPAICRTDSTADSLGRHNSKASLRQAAMQNTSSCQAPRKAPASQACLLMMPFIVLCAQELHHHMVVYILIQRPCPSLAGPGLSHLSASCSLQSTPCRRHSGC